MPKRRTKNLHTWGTIAVLGAAFLAAGLWQRYEKIAELEGLSENGAVCSHVTDGDTVDVRTRAGKRVRVRLLGIDCPETHNERKGQRQARDLGMSYPELVALGEEATRATREALHGKVVTLVFEGDEPPLDDYGRALCYVEADGVDHGETLLSLGLAEPRRERHPRFGIYARAAASARGKRAGIYR
jgi:micrococcal nuclease